MPNISIDVTAGGSQGDWLIMVDHDGLSEVGVQILDGMSRHIGLCINAAWAFFKIDPCDLSALDGLLDRVNTKLDADRALIAKLPENAMIADMRPVLSDFLDLAHWWMCASLNALADERYVDAVKRHTRSVELLTNFTAFLRVAANEDGSYVAAAINAAISSRAAAAVNIRHNKSGGSNEKKRNIIKIWGSGKYTTREICAEEECGDLGISFSTARKALRNTPDPT